MIDEKQEFRAYTTFPSYTAEDKFDRSYLGRFTFDTLLKKEGLVRVFTILARGYMWETEQPDIERARRALSAWCSLPEKKGKTEKKSDEWQKAQVSFGSLHDEFPRLVTKTGSGWYYRHIRNIVRFVEENEELVSADAQTNCTALDQKFADNWADALVHFQVPLYARGTNAAWGLRFDDILADALQQGPLRNKDIPLSDELTAYLESRIPKHKKQPKDLYVTLVKYYLANRSEDSDWVVLPVANFDAYYGTTSFGRKWLAEIPDDILIRSHSASVSRFKLGKTVAEMIESS